MNQKITSAIDELIDMVNLAGESNTHIVLLILRVQGYQGMTDYLPKECRISLRMYSYLTRRINRK